MFTQIGFDAEKFKIALIKLVNAGDFNNTMQSLKTSSPAFFRNLYAFLSTLSSQQYEETREQVCTQAVQIRRYSQQELGTHFDAINALGIACHAEQEAALELQRQQEAALELQRQQEAALELQRQQEAALALQRQQEAALALQRQQEAALELQRQQETALELQRQQEAALALQRQQEAALELQRQQETALELQRQQETALALQRQQETALELQRQQETALALQRQQETALELQRQQETALALQRQQETALELQRQQETALALQRQQETALELQRQQEATRCIEAAQFRFLEYRFNAELNITRRHQTVINALANVPTLRIAYPRETEHLKLLLTAARDALQTHIHSAEGCFQADLARFNAEPIVTNRLQTIDHAIRDAGTHALTPIAETHYRSLLTAEQRALAAGIAAAQAKFDNYRFIDQPNVDARHQAVVAALANIRLQAVADPNETSHLTTLLTAERDALQRQKEEQQLVLLQQRAEKEKFLIQKVVTGLRLSPEEIKRYHITRADEGRYSLMVAESIGS